MASAEVFAETVYNLAGHSLREPPGTPVLLQRILRSTGRIVTERTRTCVDVLRTADGIIARVPADGPRERRNVAFALAAIRATGILVGPSLCSEDEPDAVLAVIMPRPALQAVVRLHGTRLDAVASAFIVSHDMAHERLRIMRRPASSGEYTLPTFRFVG